MEVTWEICSLGIGDILYILYLPHPDPLFTLFYAAVCIERLTFCDYVKGPLWPGFQLGLASGKYQQEIRDREICSFAPVLAWLRFGSGPWFSIKGHNSCQAALSRSYSSNFLLVLLTASFLFASSSLGWYWVPAVASLGSFTKPFWFSLTLTTLMKVVPLLNSPELPHLSMSSVSCWGLDWKRWGGD